MLTMLGAFLLQDGLIGARLGETHVEGRLTQCSLSFDVQRLGGLISVVLEEGTNTPLVELMFFSDHDNPAPIPVHAVLLDGAEENSADQRPPPYESAWEGSFAFKMGEHTSNVVAHLIQRRTLRFSYTLPGGAGTEASVFLTRYEAAHVTDCLKRLMPEASYLR